MPLSRPVQVSKRPLSQGCGPAPDFAGTDHRIIHTGRLVLSPVSGGDQPELIRLKADPRVFAQMLGGVRDVVRAQQELAHDIAFWAAHGYGLWSVREAGVFEGIVGFHDRPDGRGVGLRFAFWPEARGRGLAREACGAALRYAHEIVGLARVVAVARESNIASRTVLGAVGMTECDAFDREGFCMLVYESLARRFTHPNR